MWTRLLLATILFPVFARAVADDAKAEAGKRVYADYCATCHGEDLQNNSSATFDLRRLREGERARFVGAVTNGKKAMPSWKGVLGEDKIDALWAYVRANAYP
jgi:mono/diheme cytochrome c family protein